VAAISAGEKVSEEEEFARILTARSIRAEEGREREFDGRGEAPATAMAAAVVWTSIWPWSGSNGLMNGRRGCGARLCSSGHEESKRSGKGVVGAATATITARSGSA
jgi:hypothetical protein